MGSLTPKKKKKKWGRDLEKDSRERDDSDSVMMDGWELPGYMGAFQGQGKTHIKTS